MSETRSPEPGAVDAPRTLVPDHPGWPASLGDLPRPPRSLHLIGDASLLARPLVAIVGTRDPSLYGERIARRLAGGLARAGVVVVSGMARGIDAAAHEGALEAGGSTIAVLGTGVDIAYPAFHRALHRRISAEGLLVSELPSGARPHRGSFPERNRIIAALCRATIVVEAGHRSGALITAGVALDLGRAVAAVPGPIDDARAAGSNALIRDGAIVVCDDADALAVAGHAAPSIDVPRPRPVLSADEAAVWDALAVGPSFEDALIGRTALDPARCMAAITTLELAGLVECTITGEIRRL